jgi:uncharacterized protein
MKTEVIWDQLIDRGLEHLILNQDAQIEARGLVVGMLKDAAYRVQYQIVCDLGWNVKRVRVGDLLNNEEISFFKGQESDWVDERGQVIQSLRGCTEVDIMVTPFTNTLPIRRLNLAQGESQEMAVVYIAVPDLDMSRVEQRYTCLSKDKNGGVYRYENLKSGFTSDLRVDAEGLVVDYPGIFKLVWKKAE